MSTTTNDPSPITLHGGCYCRAVRYTIKPTTGLPTVHTLCHCRTCQQISGSAFLPFVGFPTSQAEFSSTPPHALTTFAASKFADRQFCALCGSTLTMVYHGRGDRVSVVVASFDEESVLLLPGPTQHIFVGERAPWFGLGEDGIECWELMPAGAEAYLGGQLRQSG